MTKIQESGERVVANVERVIVGKHHEVRLALVALLCRGHLLIEDVPGTGKTMLAKAIARSLGCTLPAHPVHAGPAADRRHRAVDLQPEDPGVRVPAGPDHGPGGPRGRDQPGDAEDPVEPPRMHGGAPVDGRRDDLHDARPVPRDRDPEPDRVRGHVRPARGPARPVPAAHPARLPPADRGDRHPRRAEAGPPARRDRGRAARSRSFATSRPRSRRSTSTRRSATTSCGSSTGPGTTPTCTSARRRADRSRCTGPARRMAALLGRDYVIPDDIKALAEPALAHRLIIKTSSTIHDVQPGQVVRELLDTTPVEGIRPQGRGDRPPLPRRDRRVATTAALGEDRHEPPDARRRDAPVIRRLQALVVATVLLIAAVLDRPAVPLLPALPGRAGRRRRATSSPASA